MRRLLVLLMLVLLVGSDPAPAKRGRSAASSAAAPSGLGANGFNIPLLSLHETAPYFYSGLASTLARVLDGSQDGNGGTRHHFVSDAGMGGDLLAFLRSIDDTTPTFP